MKRNVVTDAAGAIILITAARLQVLDDDGEIVRKGEVLGEGETWHAQATIDPFALDGPMIFVDGAVVADTDAREDEDAVARMLRGEAKAEELAQIDRAIENATGRDLARLRVHRARVARGT